MKNLFLVSVGALILVWIAILKLRNDFVPFEDRTGIEVCDDYVVTLIDSYYRSGQEKSSEDVVADRTLEIDYDNYVIYISGVGMEDILDINYTTVRSYETVGYGTAGEFYMSENYRAYYVPGKMIKLKRFYPGTEIAEVVITMISRDYRKQILKRRKDAD